MPRKVSGTNHRIQLVRQNKGIQYGWVFPPAPVAEMTAQVQNLRLVSPSETNPAPETAIDELGLTFTGILESADGPPVTVDLEFGQTKEEAKQAEKIPAQMQKLTLKTKLTIPGNFWGTEKGIVFVGAPGAAGSGMMFNVGSLYVAPNEGDNPAEIDAENREMARLRRELNLRNKRLGLTMPPALTPETKRCEGCGMEFVPASRSDQRFHDHACEARFNAKRRRAQKKAEKVQAKGTIR